MELRFNQILFSNPGALGIFEKMKSNKKEYQELVLKNTIPINKYQKDGIGPFQWLGDSIRNSKRPLRINSVDYIVLKILNRNLAVYDFNKKLSFQVYVIGTFRSYFNPTYKVAEAFSDFYLEMGILPNIISVPKSELMKNSKEYSNKLRNGILLYERG